MTWCISKSEIWSVISFCHDHTYGGHFGPRKIAKKVFQSGFCWPILLKVLLISANYVHYGNMWANHKVKHDASATCPRGWDIQFKGDIWSIAKLIQKSIYTCHCELCFQIGWGGCHKIERQQCCCQVLEREHFISWFGTLALLLAIMEPTFQIDHSRCLWETTMLPTS